MRSKDRSIRKELWKWRQPAVTTGPLDADKTLSARSMPGILPKLTVDGALDVTRLYSVADQLPTDEPLIRQHPFHSPHHSVSYAGLEGGGR